MERWLPEELVEHIHSLNVAANHRCLMVELRATVEHDVTGWETAEGTSYHPKQKADTYKLVMVSALDGRRKRVVYTNRPIDPAGTWRSVLRVESYVEHRDVIFGETCRQTLLDHPLHNATTWSMDSRYRSEGAADLT